MVVVDSKAKQERYQNVHDTTNAPKCPPATHFPPAGDTHTGVLRTLRHSHLSSLSFQSKHTTHCHPPPLARTTSTSRWICEPKLRVEDVSNLDLREQVPTDPAIKATDEHVLLLSAEPEWDWDRVGAQP